MYHPMSEKQILLTPKLATTLSKECESLSRERPFMAWWAEELTRYIKNDQIVEIPTVVIAHRNGTKYRLNGQHTIAAVLKAQKPLPVFLREYRCDNQGDLSEIYGLIDNHSQRTLSHVTGVELDVLGLDWPTDLGTKIALAAARIIYGWNTGRGISKNYKKELIGMFQGEGNFIVDIYKEDRATFRRHMARMPVMMAMMNTFRKCKKDATAFWPAVRDGENLKRSDPRKKLREWLRDVVVQGSAATNPHKVTEREMYSRCITAWNAFRKGTTTSLRYYPNKPIPKVL